MKSSAIIMSILMLLPATSALSSSIWGDSYENNETNVIQILQYLDVNDNSKMVVLNAGKNDGVLEGTALKVFRSSNQTTGTNTQEKVWIETGMLKIVEIQNKISIAEVTSQNSKMSSMFFPDFPGIMAGDLAVVKTQNVARKQIVTPTTNLSYSKLFEDPKSRPETFELSREGRKEIMAAVKIYARSRVSLLMVEGYTDHRGPRNVNQVESYQRALTVRQFLIDELGFDPDKVLAVGYGEGEPADSSLAPGFEEANRRIVFKAVPANL